MRPGEIAGSATHAELMRQDGPYAGMLLDHDADLDYEGDAFLASAHAITADQWRTRAGRPACVCSPFWPSQLTELCRRLSPNRQERR